jgi:hypothetical protein
MGVIKNSFVFSILSVFYPLFQYSIIPFRIYRILSISSLANGRSSAMLPLDPAMTLAGPLLTSPIT